MESLTDHYVSAFNQGKIGEPGEAGPPGFPVSNCIPLEYEHRNILDTKVIDCLV